MEHPNKVCEISSDLGLRRSLLADKTPPHFLVDVERELAFFATPRAIGFNFFLPIFGIEVDSEEFIRLERLVKIG